MPVLGARGHLHCILVLHTTTAGMHEQRGGGAERGKFCRPEKGVGWGRNVCAVTNILERERVTDDEVMTDHRRCLGSAYL